ncbi:hypothetical protein GCM10009817_00030 [Terrabacter lapilli]|uniref:AB hydrolase-1 domain-containing protein n=1 Tax=Terrabacter lapilli TaxID=436231 RepID=A0ABN2R671_9MICO
MTTTTNQRRRHPVPGSAVAAAGLALGLGLTGCTTGAHPNAAGTTPTTPTPASISASAPARGTTPALIASAPVTLSGGEIDMVVAGRHFRARCDGTGPAIIVVADYGRSMDDAGPALHHVVPHAQACLYDRLGVGRSDAAPHLQTFASQADDLEGVITGLGLTRPVVVIGDSLGAPIALTWASRHVKDARAVVLLMPPPPGFMGPHGALNRLMPPKNPGDLELSRLWTEIDHYNNPALNRESLDPRSWDEYLRLPPTSTPLYDLVAPTLSWLASIDAKKVNDAWQQGQSRVLRLSSSAQLIRVATETDWPAVLQRTLERAVQS